jgi:ArsR family transcriptional regulator, arsenate/arsenite/antimonite-responsive transcriptional repressor
MKQPLEQLKALSDRNRLRVVAALMNEEELCACHIANFLGITGATASRHLDLLIRSGLVESRKDGRWVHYRLSPTFPAPIFQWLEKNLSSDPDIKRDLKKLKKITGCA